MKISGPSGLRVALIASFRCGVWCRDCAHALQTERFVPFVLLVAEYAVPVALMIWCIKEETHRQGWKKSS